MWEQGNDSKMKTRLNHSEVTVKSKVIQARSNLELEQLLELQIYFPVETVINDSKIPR